MRTKMICLAGLAVFGVLSVTDFVQTYALISGGDGQVYEANPVADAWLQRYGWHGLAAFKVGAALVFVGSAALLVRLRPRAGVAVVALGCTALLLVTAYSQRLLADQPGGDDAPGAEAALVVVAPVPPPPGGDPHHTIQSHPRLPDVAHHSPVPSE